MSFDAPEVSKARTRSFPFGSPSSSPQTLPCPRAAATASCRPGAWHSARPPPVRDRTTAPFVWGRRRATSASLLGFVRAYDFFGERTVRSCATAEASKLWPRAKASNGLRASAWIGDRPRERR